MSKKSSCPKSLGLAACIAGCARQATCKASHNQTRQRLACNLARQGLQRPAGKFATGRKYLAKLAASQVSEKPTQLSLL